MIACAGLAIFALTKWHKLPAATTEERRRKMYVPVVTVQTSMLKRMTLHRYVDGYGTVEPAPATADQPAAGGPLSAPSAGVVAKVNVCRGQEVKEGDVLVELNSGTTTFSYAQGGSGAAEKIIRATKHFVEKFAGRRGAAGVAANYRARCPAPSRASTSSPARRWM